MFATLLALAIGYTLHAKDVFQPPRPAPLATWSETVPHREPLSLKLPSGPTLRGWLYRTEQPSAPWVLFFPGSNDDLVHEAKRLAWLSDTLRVNAVGFDLPGYGFSEGAISIPAIQTAALQEFDYIARRLVPAPSTPVFVYGWSIGTSLALHVAAERHIAGLILQAPPATAREMTQWSSRHDVPWFGRGLVKITADPAVAQLYEGAAVIRQVRSPLLVLHGQLDDVVPIDQGRELFRASPATDKQFVEVPGAHHNDLPYTQPPASTALANFLRRQP